MADILFLCQRLPYPPNKGEKIRAFHILKHLSSRHRIHLGCFIDSPDDWNHVDPIKALCASTHFQGLNPTFGKIASARGLLTGDPLSVAFYANTPMQSWVEGVLSKEVPAAAFIYSSAMARFLPLGSERPDTVVIDYVDVDSDKWRQYAETKTWPMSWIYRREAKRLLDFDRTQAAHAKASVFVSKPEAALFEALAPEIADRVAAIANGVDGAYFSPGSAAPELTDLAGPVLLFTGTMDYWPNVDAVVWFAQDVLPLVQAEQPDTCFVIAGARPAPDVERLAERLGVLVTGAVDDMRPYLERADVVVAPMRIARGVQNKVLEAMAMAKPVVTSPQGLEGIAAQAGRDLLVADTPAEFKENVLVALDQDRSLTLGQAARRLIVEKYDWPAQLAAFDDLLGV